MQRVLLVSSIAGAAVLAGSFATPRSARAQTFELEAAYEEYGAAFRAGVALGDRLVLQVGAGFTSVRQSIEAPAGIGVLGGTGSAMALSIPLDAKIYLVLPTAGTVVPLVRIEARYEHARFAQTESNGVYAALLAGAQYMVTDVLGVLVEGGVDYGVTCLDPSLPVAGVGGLGGLVLATETETLRFRWRAGIVLRI